MYYDTLSRNTVKIVLTRGDMDRYSLESESLRTRSAESKRSLTGFLKKFQSESSLFKDHKPERLFLEAFPSDDGGCVMYVSTLGTGVMPAQEPEDRTETVMCTVGSFSDAAHFCRCISGKAERSALYRLGADYCIIVGADTGAMCDICRIAEEFGEMTDEPSDIAYITEYGDEICGSGAAELISGLR
ncbi:MAG: adaptor protein MecA [Ruminiclostridium sp.]|nr:adaptor protein MecA [Ruminiclostridium sp.]